MYVHTRLAWVSPTPTWARCGMEMQQEAESKTSRIPTIEVLLSDQYLAKRKIYLCNLEEKTLLSLFAVFDSNSSSALKANERTLLQNCMITPNI